MNEICFGHTVSNTGIEDRIIDTVIYRAWMKPKLRKHIGYLMKP